MSHRAVSQSWFFSEPLGVSLPVLRESQRLDSVAGGQGVSAYRKPQIASWGYHLHSPVLALFSPGHHPGCHRTEVGLPLDQTPSPLSPPCSLGLPCTPGKGSEAVQHVSPAMVITGVHRSVDKLYLCRSLRLFAFKDGTQCV